MDAPNPKDRTMNARMLGTPLYTDPASIVQGQGHLNFDVTLGYPTLPTVYRLGITCD